MDGLQRFHDRREAGQLLARQLAHYKDRDDVVVLGFRVAACPLPAKLLGI